MNQKIGIIVGCIIITILAVAGGKMMIDHKKQEDRMVEIVNSEEAERVFENGLKELDPKALTNEGLIKSYKIDKESIRHNPMGGIMVKLIINSDDKQYVNVTLDKNSDTNNLEESSGAISSKLSKKLGR